MKIKYQKSGIVGRPMQCELHLHFNKRVALAGGVTDKGNKFFQKSQLHVQDLGSLMQCR